MSLVLLLSLGLFTATSASASDDALNANALLEPKVSLFRGVLPPNVCKELIAIGEREGFNVHAESIDDYEEGYKASGQSIDVYERNGAFRTCSIFVSRIRIHQLIIWHPLTLNLSHKLSCRQKEYKIQQYGRH